MQVPKALSPLLSHDYRILAAAMVASLFGAGMWAVGIVYQVMELGGTEVDLSFVATATALGLVVFALVGGVAADRIPKRWILIAVEAANTLAVGFTVTMHAVNLLQIWHLALTGFILGASAAFFFPAYSAILPRILPRSGCLQRMVSRGCFGRCCSRQRVLPSRGC
ncbi:MFS transporter [Humidisolicoccus flavus]